MSENKVELSYGMEKLTTTTQRHPLGTLGELPDGRKFRYAFSGEAITAGKVVMQKVGVAAHDMDLVTAAAAAGVSDVVPTLGATAATIDQYADGYFYVNSTAGEGHVYRIKSAGAAGGEAHAANAGSLALTVHLAEPLVDALTASSETGLMENPYKDVEVYDQNDIDGPALGVTPCDVANDRYFWCQRAGVAACLMDNTTFVLGSGVAPSAVTDGAVTLFDTSGTGDRQNIGTVTLIVAASADYGLVELHME